MKNLMICHPMSNVASDEHWLVIELSQNHMSQYAFIAKLPTGLVLLHDAHWSCPRHQSVTVI